MGPEATASGKRHHTVREKPHQAAWREFGKSGAASASPMDRVGAASGLGDTTPTGDFCPRHTRPLTRTRAELPDKMFSRMTCGNVVCGP